MGEACGLGCLILGDVCGDNLKGGELGDSERLLVSMVTGEELLEDTWDCVDDSAEIEIINMRTRIHPFNTTRKKADNSVIPIHFIISNSLLIHIQTAADIACPT